MFPDLNKYSEIAYDTETTGLNPMDGAVIFGFSISCPDGKDFYWDVRKNPQSIQWLCRAIKSYEGDIICHNLSFDYRMTLVSFGLDLGLSRCFDTGILACLINEHENSYSLDNLAAKYTNCPKQGAELYEKMAEIFGGRASKNVQMPRISQAPVEIVAPYAKADTRATFELYQWQKSQIADQGLQKILDFERKVTPLIISTELDGIRVDIPAAETAVCVINDKVKLAQKELNDEVGFACNPQPSKDMVKVFKPIWKGGCWWACDGTMLKETASGAAQLDASALRSMKHPAAAMILKLRSLIKTRDTFLSGHILESSVNGRIYPNINQAKGDTGGTSTGRLSYYAPALQQIPDRDKEVAKVVKSIFLPDEGHVWLDADKASFEVRIFAHLVGTADICQAYVDNPETDFHQFVADLTGLVRNATYNGQPNAKQLNLSMIFNQGKGTTADTMGMPWTWETFTPKDSDKEITYKKPGPEALAIIEKYHAALPGVAKLAEGAKATAERRGYLFTKYGRHLRFPKGHKSYKASGILIQATSADENKKSWIRICEALQNTGAKLKLNTHDSYSMSIPIGEEEKLARKVKAAVERDRGLRVPLILEVQHPGKNWWESKSSDRWL